MGTRTPNAQPILVVIATLVQVALFAAASPVAGGELKTPWQMGTASELSKATAADTVNATASPIIGDDGLKALGTVWTVRELPELTDESYDYGLTEVQMWAPEGSIAFKTAATCHLPSHDFYAVYAAFQVEVPDGGIADELWYLLVDGLSSYHTYGEVVLASRVTSEEVISQVACTGDGRSTSFVAWDRSDDAYDTDNLHWARVSLGGAAEVFDTVGACNGRYASWAPGIAYADDPTLGEVLAISSAPRGDCNHCWAVLDARTGTRLARGTDFASAIGTTTRATAIADTGDGGWLMAWLAFVDGDDDGHPTAIFARRIDRNGDGAYGDLTPLWDSGAVAYAAMPDHIDLVPPGDDDAGHFLVQTFARAAWVNGNAEIVEPTPWIWPFNPTEDGPWDHVVACGYGGEVSHLPATSFRGTDRGRTHRRHWTRFPYPAIDRYDVDGAYRVPIACAATPDGDDPEVLLVRAYPHPGSAAADYLYLNLHPAE